MKNVYDQVRRFYEQEQEWPAPISREWVEGFLRQKAWQGTGDEDLSILWRQLELFNLYLMYIDNLDLADLTQNDYQRAMEWLDRHVTGFSANKRSMRRFLGVVKDFYEYLLSRKITVDMEALIEAEASIETGNKLKHSRPKSGGRDNRLTSDELAKLIREHGTDLETDLGRMIGETAEGLMTKLGVFFQQDNFTEDLRRALFLYSGPTDIVIEEENEEFWLGFWDYFLFDYHLLQNDQIALAYFAAECGEDLNSEEKVLLAQLLEAHFTVFYVSKISSQDWVECVNLFTDETFQLPMPEFDYKSLKQALFYGHIFSQDIVMVNYVTSVEVSTILRRRIREQIIKQKKIFEIQIPNASWGDFFSRHSLAVRHAIDRMLHLATVNVTPFFLLENEYPHVARTRQPDKSVEALIVELMREYSFSLHDTQLAQRLWGDYSQFIAGKIRNPAVWAGAVMFAYAQLNYPHGLTAKQIAGRLKISPKGIYANRAKIAGALQLTTFDPRYLSEEGLVCALFLS